MASATYGDQEPLDVPMTHDYNRTPCMTRAPSIKPGPFNVRTRGHERTGGKKAHTRRRGAGGVVQHSPFYPKGGVAWLAEHFPPHSPFSHSSCDPDWYIDMIARGDSPVLFRWTCAVFLRAPVSTWCSAAAAGRRENLEFGLAVAQMLALAGPKARPDIVWAFRDAMKEALKLAAEDGRTEVVAWAIANNLDVSECKAAAEEENRPDILALFS